MQVTKKALFYGYFLYKLFWPFTILIARAGNSSCFLCFLTTIYTLYSRNFIQLMETAKQKRSVDTHKAEKGKWDRIEYRGDA